MRDLSAKAAAHESADGSPSRVQRPANATAGETQEVAGGPPGSLWVKGEDGGATPIKPAGRALGRIATKEYYSIGEVCEITRLKPHVLRYWESQFRILNPSKNRAGNRAYRRKDIQLVQLVKHLLYTEKFTIEGARHKLDDIRRGKETGLEPPSAEANATELLRDLNAELEELNRKIEQFRGAR